MKIEVGYCYLHPSEQIALCELFFDYHENPNDCPDEKIARMVVLMEKLVIADKSKNQAIYKFVDRKRLSLALCLYLKPIFDEGPLKILPKYDTSWGDPSIEMKLSKTRSIGSEIEI